MTIENVFNDIRSERAYQEELWGIAFDNKNTVNDWTAYIAAYTGRATRIGASPDQQREGMLNVAALAVAALEAFDRNGGYPPRHYDVGSL